MKRKKKRFFERLEKFFYVTFVLEVFFLTCCIALSFYNDLKVLILILS
jgi:hypothetical protein